MEDSEEIFDSSVELVGQYDEGPITRSPNEKIALADVLQVYLACLGDAEKTSAVIGLDAYTVEEVERLATEGNWQRKVEALKKLRADKGADAFAKELNRLANFSQCCKLRRILDRSIRDVQKGRRFADFISVHGKHASNTSFKACLELVKACETLHKMSYSCLGDSLTERAANFEEGNPQVSVATSVLAALNAGRKMETPQLYEPKEKDKS